MYVTAKLSLNVLRPKSLTKYRLLYSCFHQVCSRRLDGNIEHYYVDQSNNRRPLVVVFGWMLAKPKHIQKFCNLYLNRGFDVITVQVRPLQIIFPTRIQQVVQNLIYYLEAGADNDIIIHGLSVGGYVYSELLVKLEKDRDRYSGLSNRIIAQIFDSPVDMDGIPRGFANIIFKNRYLQLFLKTNLELYLRVFEHQITKHYRKGSTAFKTNRLKIPSLMLYSQSDPVGCPKRIEETMDNWHKHGVEAYSKTWLDSPHVEHFRMHETEYIEILFSFLDKCIAFNPDEKLFKNKVKHKNMN